MLFERVTFNLDVIAGKPTLLDGILLPILPRLARRCIVDTGARTMCICCVCEKQTNKFN